ncbi:hypothetical protein EMGBS12_04370 [Methylophilaceae bacterium]|nr:hypothetical protein EMGBS12_04370 [Methylophilaceae bacterium]
MRFIKFFFIVLGFSFLQSCSNPSLYQSKHYVFGTIVDISIYDEDEEKAEKVTKAVLEEFTRLHQSLHAWEKSDLTNLNESISKISLTEMPLQNLLKLLKMREN